MTPERGGSHHKTYEAIFRHPVAHNLHWRDVWSMLGALCETQEQENGNLKVSHNGHTLVLHPSRGKDMADIAEVMEVRRFLEKSGAALPATAAKGVHLLVVIDHRSAKIFRTEGPDALPERLTPYDPTGKGRYLHNVEDDSDGKRKPENGPFYEAIAQSLQNAEQVLVFGSGTGTSSAMDQLIVELTTHHPDLARRVVGSVVVNQQHQTEDQLLAQAREFYAALPVKVIKPMPVAKV